MSFLDFIKDTDAEPRPRRVMLYGTHGIGKSTWAACAPNPVFIRTEDGLRDIKGAKTFPLCKSIDDAFAQIQALKTEKHNFQTVALDSADWLEQLVWKHLCAEAGKQSLADFGFGKGYETAAAIFRTFLDELSELNIQRGMTAILIAHCAIVRFEDPTTDAYDRYEPKLHKKTVGAVQEWADEVLFANYKVYTKTDGTGFDERKIATGGGERVIHTTEKPGHLAKNRLALPPEMPMEFASYWDAVKAASGRVVIGGQEVKE